MFIFEAGPRYEVAWLILDPIPGFNVCPSLFNMICFFFVCPVLTAYTSATIQSMRLDHGSPITRRRVFIILILKEIMDQSVRGHLQDFCEATRERLRILLDLHWPLGTSSLKFVDFVKLTVLNLIAHFHHPIHTVPGRTFSWTTGARLFRTISKQNNNWGKKTWLVQGHLALPNKLHQFWYTFLKQSRSEAGDDNVPSVPFQSAAQAASKECWSKVEAAAHSMGWGEWGSGPLAIIWTTLNSNIHVLLHFHNFPSLASLSSLRKG